MNVKCTWKSIHNTTLTATGNGNDNVKCTLLKANKEAGKAELVIKNVRTYNNN